MLENVLVVDRIDDIRYRQVIECDMRKMYFRAAYSWLFLLDDAYYSHPNSQSHSPSPQEVMDVVTRSPRSLNSTV
jgi:hypothetical protein